MYENISGWTHSRQLVIILLYLYVAWYMMNRRFGKYGVAEVDLHEIYDGDDLDLLLADDEDSS